MALGVRRCFLTCIQVRVRESRGREEDEEEREEEEKEEEEWRVSCENEVPIERVPKG